MQGAPLRIGTSGTAAQLKALANTGALQSLGVAGVSDSVLANIKGLTATQDESPKGGAAGKTVPDLSAWVAAVTKLIPSEVVAAYLSGRALLQANMDHPKVWLWVVWTLFCLGAVIVLRRWMTSDSSTNTPAQWSAVITAAVSFLVWVYSFGDIFQLLQWWDPTAAGLLLIAWTLAAPALHLLLSKLLHEPD